MTLFKILSKFNFWKKTTKIVPIKKAVILDSETFLNLNDIEIYKDNSNDIYIHISYDIEYNDGFGKALSFGQIWKKITNEDLEKTRTDFKKIRERYSIGPIFR